MITDFKWELNCLEHLGKAMQKSGPGTFLAKARECSSSFQLGYSNFIIPLTSLTIRVIKALIVSPVFIFHTLFLYFEAVVIKQTLRNVGSAPTRGGRLSRCMVTELLPTGLLPQPWPFRKEQGTAVAGKRLVLP